MAEEILNRDRYGQELLARWQGFAQNVNQLQQSQQGLNNQFTLGTAGAGTNQGALNLQALGQQYGLGTNLANMDYSRQQQNVGNAFQNAQLQTQSAFNPINTIFNTNSQNVGLNQNLANQGLGFTAGAYSNPYVQETFNPFNPYAQDVFSSNFNAANDRYIAAGNNAAGLAAGQSKAQADLSGYFLATLGKLLKR